MKITGNTKVKDVLAYDEDKMIRTLMWLAPEFERLQYPKLRRAMAGRVSVSQAARIARVPLTEILYALNLAIGVDEAELAAELRLFQSDDFTYRDTNPPIKPIEIAKIKDDAHNVIFLDLLKYADDRQDPMPAIIKGLVRLKDDGVLLLRHPFDPIPLRDMFARRGFESWAEERKPGTWHIYFFRPVLKAAACAHPSVPESVYIRTFSATA